MGVDADLLVGVWKIRQFDLLMDVAPPPPLPPPFKGSSFEGSDHAIF